MGARRRAGVVGLIGAGPNARQAGLDPRGRPFSEAVRLTGWLRCRASRTKHIRSAWSTMAAMVSASASELISNEVSIASSRCSAVPARIEPDMTKLGVTSMLAPVIWILRASPTRASWVSSQNARAAPK